MAVSPLGGLCMVYYHNYYYILLRSAGLPAAALVCVCIVLGGIGPSVSEYGYYGYDNILV